MQPGEAQLLLPAALRHLGTACPPALPPSTGAQGCLSPVPFTQRAWHRAHWGGCSDLIKGQAHICCLLWVPSSLQSSPEGQSCLLNSFLAASAAEPSPVSETLLQLLAGRESSSAEPWHRAWLGRHTAPFEKPVLNAIPLRHRSPGSLSQQQLSLQPGPL